MSEKPRPVPDETSAPFWEATARGELALARCAHCHAFAHPPAPVCPFCGSTDPSYAFEVVSGGGAIRSWTVIRQSFLPGFDVPFVLADVALDGTDDVRLIGRLVDGEPSPGARVTIVFEDAVPAFAVT